MKNVLKIDPKSTWRPIFGKPALPVVIDKIMSVLKKRRPRLAGAAGAAAGMFLSQLPGPLAAEVRKPLAYPADAVEPPWVDTRRDMQLATAARFRAFVGFTFTDRCRESGIGFVNVTTADTGKNYRASHYDHGNGVAAADVDGDGLADIYFSTQVGANELWRNLGGGRFANITATSGTSLAEALGVAASFGDTDNDGDPDLYATTVRGGNFLFANDGAGRFTDATAASGLAYSGHSSASVFFDYDRDGLLDLFLCNVGVYTTEEILEAPADALNPGKGEPYQYFAAHADAFAGHLKPERTERSILYRNEGGNRFSDVSEAVGLVDTSWSGDASPIDANEDGWPDLYILDMQGNDDYFENAGGQRFVRRSREVFPKSPWGSMGVKAFDYDNDGDFDLFVSDMHSDMSDEVGPGDEKKKADIKYSDEFLASGGHSIFGNAFYRNEGGGSYLEISDGIGGENYWPWGLSTGDLNADGYEDIFLASSMNYPFRYGVNTLLVNDLGEAFLDAEYILGVEPRRDSRTTKAWFLLDCGGADKEHDRCERQDGLIEIWASLGSRSSVIFDIEGDGDLDIVTNEFNSEPQVFVSDLSERKQINYLGVKLAGGTSNRSGIGAVVSVEAGGASYRKANDGQSGYLSQSDLPLYFGLGAAASVDGIVVRWPSGTTQTVPGPLAINRLIEVTEK